MSAVAPEPPTPKRRVSAAERREELIAAAVPEFAIGGLHGTTVATIARRVGVAQPYVFTLFETKLDLFLAAVERSFEAVAALFRTAAAEYEAGELEDAEDLLHGIGIVYTRMLEDDRDYLLLQYQAYAACSEEAVRARVRHLFAGLIELARELSGADQERIDEFLRYGMALNVAAALNVENLSCEALWVSEALAAG